MNSRGWSHNPTPKPLGHGHIWCLRERSNLRDWLFRPALVHLSYTGESLVDTERIELSSSRCKREVLPLNDIPTNWYQRMESNHLLRAYQTRAQPESFAGMEVSARIELASPRYKCCASPAMLADHKSLEPRPRIERESHLYQRCTLPLSYQGWSQGGESNSGRSVTSALLSH